MMNQDRISVNWRQQVTEDDLLARIAWAHLSEACNATLTALIDDIGPAGALAFVLENPRRFEAVMRRWSTLDLLDVLNRGRRLGVRYIAPGDAEWPLALDDLPEPPHVLFALGERELAPTVGRSVALVGARAATAYGERIAAQLGCDLGTKGFTVVSGGAFGIDAAAHRGALVESAGTVCVLAGGVDQVYPQAHYELFQSIKRNGLLVSESPLGARPMRQRFLHRNRLIAALTPATVVVEAGLRSGSLSTARRAADLCRIVAAIPGPVTSAASAGCHELIRDGVATLVTDAGDILELLEGYGRGLINPQTKVGQTLPQDSLTARAACVWDALPLHDGQDVETIGVDANLPTEDVIAGLGELQLAGLAHRESGLWKKTPLTKSTSTSTLAAVVRPERFDEEEAPGWQSVS